VRPNQVWSADITYVPMAQGFTYGSVKSNGSFQDCALIRRLLQEY
jgi:hypothetical protein